MNDYALVIGIDHYVDGSMHQLNGAINDAQDFFEWVTSEAGGKVNKEKGHAMLLTSNEDLSELFMNHIEDAFKILYDLANQDKQNTRRFYFYFSGHGIGINLDSVALILTNWGSLLANRGISSNKFHTKIREMGVYKETMFFLDCCRSQKINVEGTTPAVWLPGINRTASNVDSFTAFATKYSDVAVEADIDGRSNGYFTKALLEGLNGQAASADGKIRLGKLKGFLTLRTSELSKNQNWAQEVRFEDKYSLDAIISEVNTTEFTDLAGREIKYEVIIHFNENINGEFDLIDKNAEVVDSWNNGVRMWPIKLHSGLYLLKKKNGNDQYPFIVKKQLKSIQNVQI